MHAALICICITEISSAGDKKTKFQHSTPCSDSCVPIVDTMICCCRSKMLIVFKPTNIGSVRLIRVKPTVCD